MKTKHIFITGGVVSSLGKGITGAALAFLLKQRGYRVAMQKLDPDLNVDPGTMSPYQHGEVFVTDDGAETDLDLGHYERIAGVNCSHASNYTSGRIYGSVIARERAGGYLGGTVQVVPHITDEIKAAIRSLESDDVDIAITEIGGTTGDIESLPFQEATRDPMNCSLPGTWGLPGDSPGKNTVVGHHALLQGIFPIQGSNPGLPHGRRPYSLGNFLKS